METAITARQFRSDILFAKLYKQ